MTDLLDALAKLLLFPGFAFLFACAMLFAWIDRRVIARLQGPAPNLEEFRQDPIPKRLQ